MIHFSHPILLLLLLPAWFILRRGWQARGSLLLVRTGIVTALIVIAAGPVSSTMRRGATVVMVFDRSRSMPATMDRFAKDLMRRAESEMSPGDQLAAVGFGAAPLVEQFPAVGHPPETGLKRIDPEQSNLHEAIAAALELVPNDEQGRIIVVSDGLADDELSDSLAERLRRRRLAVSFLHTSRRTDGDVVLERVNCPTDVRAGDEIEFEFEIAATEAGESTLRVRRDADDLPARPVERQPGTTRITWRDQPKSPGVVRYSFALESPGDPTIENNQWDTWLRVRSGPAVLVLDDDGRESPLAELVRRAGAAVQIVAAKQANLSLERLSAFEACVIDDVPAEDLTVSTIETIGHYVEQLGGGLVVSGGLKSIATGGYRFGPLEMLLPVRLRSQSASERSPIALVLVVDTSAWETSAIDLDDQQTPLQKALLSLAQELDVADRMGITVTRSPNPVLLTLSPMTTLKTVRDAVDQLGVPGDTTLFPRALDAAWEMLSKATQPEKHLVALIGAEQIGNWQALNDPPTRAARAGGVTVTVLNWGAPPEWWLQANANRGTNRVRQMSASDASQLEPLLRQDFQIRTGGGFVERATAMLRRDKSGLIEPAANDGAPPVASGFHPAVLRTGSRATLVSQANPNLPLAAECERGLGRVSAFLFPVEREKRTDAEWERLAGMLVPRLEWTARLDGPVRAVPVAVQSRGRNVSVSLNLNDSEIAALAGSGPLELLASSAERDAARVTKQFRRVDSELVADLWLDRLAGCVPVVRTGESFVLRGPPVSLPRSPEFLKAAAGDSGRATLVRIAELSGGEEWSENMPLFGESREAFRSLVPFFAWLAMALVLLDIADRRHHVLSRLESSWRLPRPRRVTSPAADPREPEPAADIFDQAKERTRRRLQR